jgi:hypothetical protein
VLKSKRLILIINLKYFFFLFIYSVFNFTVPWLSILAIIILTIVSIILYYIPLRYLVLAFIINKFTKRFRKPKGYIDNNELADFISRLPSDPELVSDFILI